MEKPSKSDEQILKENIEKGKRWTKSITPAKTFKSIVCPPFDPIKSYKQDPSSFLLLKVDKEKKEIVVGVCSYTYELLEEFRGTSAPQIYEYILNHTKYISRLDHAAYLGKELRKAELALKNNEEYLQE